MEIQGEDGENQACSRLDNSPEGLSGRVGLILQADGNSIAEKRGSIRCADAPRPMEQNDHLSK